MIEAPLSRGNPFATRHTRPGSLPFLFPAGEDVAQLIERLRTAGWWGEIVGPHGSGKSTLLAALEPELKKAGRQVLRNSLHDGQRQLPADVWRQRFTSHTQLVIDGYEQLGRWQRWRIKRRCKLSNCGLLATVHSSAGLPELYRTSPDLEMAVRIVQSLLSDEDRTISADQITACFRAHHGNLREMLFALYDVYERRVPRRCDVS